MRRFHLRNVVLLTLAVGIGCPYDPYAHLYVVDEPDWSEVEGVYVLSSQNVSWREEFTEPVLPTVRLLANGKYEVSAFPVWLAGDGWDWSRLDSVSLSGDWEKCQPGRVGDGSTVRPYWGIEFDPHPAGKPPSRPPSFDDVAQMRKYMSHPGAPALAREDGILKLVFGYGDPDEGRAMIFTKRAP